MCFCRDRSLTCGGSQGTHEELRRDLCDALHRSLFPLMISMGKNMSHDSIFLSPSHFSFLSGEQDDYLMLCRESWHHAPCLRPPAPTPSPPSTHSLFLVQDILSLYLTVSEVEVLEASASLSMECGCSEDYDHCEDG